MFAVLIVQLGCASAEANLVGTWKGAVEAEKKSDNPGAAVAEALGNALLTQTLEIRADHTFKWAVMGMPVEGNWSMSGNEVVFKPGAVAGVKPGAGTDNASIKAQADLRLRLEGGTLVGSPMGGAGRIVFTKQ
jgi:hypothetical protein